MAEWTIGPRHTTGVSSGTKNPIEMTLTPWPSAGDDFVSLFDGLFRHPNHHGNIRTINISIHDPNSIALLLKSHSHIHCYGRFSHSTFSATHGDNMLHAGEGDSPPADSQQQPNARDVVLQPYIVLLIKTQSVKLIPSRQGRLAHITPPCHHSKSHHFSQTLSHHAQESKAVLTKRTRGINQKWEKETDA